MRKRRRLADKLTIMVCAVLVAVSAFFYAPMDVEASVLDSYSNSGSASSTLINRHIYNYRKFNNLVNLDSLSNLESGNYYEVSYSGNITININQNLELYAQILTFNFGDYSVPLYVREKTGTVSPFSSDFSGSFIYYAVDNLELYYDLFCAFCTPMEGSALPITASHNLTLNIDSINIISQSQGDDYQNGYNAGFSAGEQAGYGNGYSQGFADGESSVDTNEIYNQGFQAGKDSVDIQSYYDAGYQAGYQVAFSDGYESGYDEGYQSAMDRIDGWGADTSNYPLILSSESGSSYFGVTVKSFSPVQYQSFFEWTSSLQLNPNHTYRFDVRLTPTRYSYGTGDTYILNSDIYYLNIGGIKYKISDFSESDINRFFIPGDRMSTAYSFSWEPYCAIYGSDTHSDLAYSYFDYEFSIYDMGPSGDTQNHIANQTDQLTGGYNDSQGNSVNNDFSAGLNVFETAEDSLFATATTGLKDFTFFDITSVPAMVTGMSFVGSIMSGWFTQAGGASGVGIVLSILFSIMLVAMVLGLYRWYQSKGGKD